VKTKESLVYIHPQYLKKERFLNLFKFFLLGLAISILIFALLYLLIYSSFFEVKKIEIKNNKDASFDNVMTFLKTNVFKDSFFKKILGFQNILIWENNYLNNSNFFAQIKKVEIKKDYLNKSLMINVFERNPIGIWCFTSKQKCYWFDNEGVLFKVAPKSEGGLILTILDDNQNNLGMGSYVLDEDTFKIFLENLEKIKEADLNIKEINIADLNLKEMIIKTFDGPEIYLSLNFPVKGLKDIVLKFKNQNKFSQLKYLDLRVENRVYYK
jgi:cell division septal protein FtsQ